MATTTKTCECKSEFQDKTYGFCVRLHNLAKEGKEARCTVCGKTKLLRVEVKK